MEYSLHPPKPTASKRCSKDDKDEDGEKIGSSYKKSGRIPILEEAVHERGNEAQSTLERHGIMPYKVARISPTMYMEKFQEHGAVALFLHLYINKFQLSLLVKLACTNL